jgi:transcriptional regulator with XRE-family HTH domain
MSFGQHLRGVREEAGLTQAALARKAKIPASTLGNWERDRGFPSAGAFLRLAEALGVSPEHLAQAVEDPAEEEGLEASREPGKQSRDSLREGK